MPTQLANDNYGRTVMFETMGSQDTYTVNDPISGSTFTVAVNTGTAQSKVYQTINSMPVNAPVVTLTTTQIYTGVVLAAMTFGQQLMVQFAVQNILAGITQAGQSANLLAYTANLSQAITTGSLYVAIAQIEAMIADTSSAKTNLSPFITNAVLYIYLNQIQAYLGVAITPNPGS